VGMEQGEGAHVGAEVGGAKYGPLAPGQRGLQVLAAAYLDQFPQGPGPAPQPHQVDDLAGTDPENVPGQPLCLRLAEPRSEYLLEVGQHRNVQSARQQAARYARRAGKSASSGASASQKATLSA